MNTASLAWSRPDTGTTPSAITITSKLAFSAAVLVVLMLGLFIATGVGQDPLQYIHTPQDYTAILLKNPPVLRAAIGLDNVFIVMYSAMFLCLGTRLWKDGSSNKALLIAALGLLGVSGLLDLLENMHFLSMIATALQGMVVSQTEIELQVWESLVKFHISYLGLFLLGFVLPNTNPLQKALCFALRYIQLPIGLLIYLVPAEFAKPLVLGRFTFFLFALLAIAVIFGQRQSGSDAPA